MKNSILKLILFSITLSLVVLFSACSSDDTESGECTHEYGEWSVTTDPTCENDGIRTRTCTKCQVPIFESISALGHTYEISEILTNATCDQPGSAKFECKRDTTHVKTDSLPALGHAYSEWSVDTAATCEVEGKEIRICANDSSHTEERTLAKLQHVFSEYSILSNATCTENEKHVATCTNPGCDYKDIVEKEGTLTAHVLSEYTSNTVASCEKNATLIARCKNTGCTFTDIKEIENSALGHRFENYTTKVPSDCSSDHLKIAICSNPNCSAEDSQVIANTAIGHKYNNGICQTCNLNIPVEKEWTLSQTQNGSVSAKLYCLKSDSFLLAVTGSGAIPDYTEGATPWSNYSNSIKELKLSGEITAIGDYAFYNLSSMASITIGESITSIGKSAFSNCFALAQIDFNAKQMADINYIIFENAGILSTGITLNIGSTVERIPAYLFFSSSEDVPNLTNIVFADSQKELSIGAHAFRDLKNLTSIVFSNSVCTIENYAFYGCRALTTLSLINSSISTIGDYAFFGCTNITEFISSDALLYIGTNAFSGCNSLVCANLGKNITTIAEAAFYKCIALSEIDFGENLTELGESAFSGCESLSDISLPDSVEKFSLSTFEGCDVISTLNGITYIDNWVVGCEKSAINAINFKEGVVGFFENAFSDCERLETILIPATVKHIMKNALNDSPKLKTVYFKSNELDWSEISINEDNSSLNTSSVLFYSEIDPKKSGTHWYYSDGKITVWNNWTTFPSPTIPLF